MKAQKSVKHLFRRGEIFYFRLACPANLWHRFNCNELKASLRTKDRTVARRRCRTLTNQFEELFMIASITPELTSSQLIDISRSFFRDALIADNDFIFMIEEMWGNDEEDRQNTITHAADRIEWLKAQRERGIRTAQIPVQPYPALAIPAYGVDTYTRLGKGCIRKFMAEVKGLKKFSTDQVGMTIFYLEGAVTDKTLTSTFLDEIRMDMLIPQNRNW